MKLLFTITLLGALSAQAADTQVYMLGKAKLKGTTRTSVVFFQDREIATLAECKEEIRLGEKGYWRYYGHKVKRLQGLSLNVSYHCLQSELLIPKWYDKNFYKYVYLIKLEGSRVQFRKMESYARCMGELRKRQPQESHDYFCTRANQKLNQSDQLSL